MSQPLQDAATARAVSPPSDATLSLSSLCRAIVLLLWLPYARAGISPALSTPHHKEDSERLDTLLRVATQRSRPPPLPRRLETLVAGRTEIDVVVSGGALRGYFLLGARQAIESREDLRVRRFSGTSAGAWAAMLMAAGVSNADWLRTYTLTAAVAREAKQQGESPPALMEACACSPPPHVPTRAEVHHTKRALRYPLLRPTSCHVTADASPLRLSMQTARTCGHGCARCFPPTRMSAAVDGSS
jgi:hypothetical protein